MVKEIVFAGEPYGMNWLREDFVYGEVLCPPELEAVSESVWEGEILTTVFYFSVGYWASASFAG